jgi:hypothetical protein
MSFKDFIGGLFMSIIFGFVVIWMIQMYTDKVKSTRVTKYQTSKETREQVSFLRDSFEMEYYKKELELYPFEHSKIPNNGGN